jgi:hypothetical protein
MYCTYVRPPSHALLPYLYAITVLYTRNYSRWPAYSRVPCPSLSDKLPRISAAPYRRRDLGISSRRSFGAQPGCILPSASTNRDKACPLDLPHRHSFIAIFARIIKLPFSMWLNQHAFQVLQDGCVASIVLRIVLPTLIFHKVRRRRAKLRCL